MYSSIRIKINKKTPVSANCRFNKKTAWETGVILVIHTAFAFYQSKGAETKTKYNSRLPV